MSRTVQDYADALPLGPVVKPDYVRQIASVDIQHVESRGAHVVATMLWNRYPHPVSHAVLPEDVLLMGGNLPIEDAALDQWAEEAVVDLVWGAILPLMSSRRTWNGRAIELVAVEPLDPRYVSGHLLGTAAPSAWDEVAQYADPKVPPPAVEQWRDAGTLVSWHWVSVHHDRVLPVYGHGAARWVADGVASIDFLELSPGLPATFGLLTIADAAHLAAAEGAHTIVCTVDVPGIELLGFRSDDGLLTIDNRFPEIEYDDLEAFARLTDDWVAPDYIQSDISRTNRATYYAG